MITIKEEFVGCDKWRRAIKLGGANAIQMWLAMKRFSAENTAAAGFVPDEDIGELHGVPRQFKKALDALVNCGCLLNKEREPGLVERVDGGWQLHDYADHNVSFEEDEVRREKARVKKRIQRANKARELAELKGQCPGTVPGHNVDPAGTNKRDGSRGVPRGGAPAHMRTPAQTQPNPTQPNQTKAAAEILSQSDHQGPPPPEPESQQLQRPWNESTPPSVLPVKDFCQRIKTYPYDDAWMQAQSRPELVRVATTLHTAAGLAPPRLMSYQSDTGVKALVELFAAGYSEAELLKVAKHLPTTPWWRGEDGPRPQKRSRGLASLSPTVVRKALDELLGNVQPPDAQRSARLQTLRNELSALKKCREGGPRYALPGDYYSKTDEELLSIEQANVAEFRELKAASQQEAANA